LLHRFLSMQRRLLLEVRCGLLRRLMSVHGLWRRLFQWFRCFVIQRTAPVTTLDSLWTAECGLLDHRLLLLAGLLAPCRRWLGNMCGMLCSQLFPHARLNLLLRYNVLVLQGAIHGGSHQLMGRYCVELLRLLPGVDNWHCLSRLLYHRCCHSWFILWCWGTCRLRVGHPS
jgi:hypothetical protein